MDGNGNSISGSKLMLVLLFLVSLVAVVAIIVAAVSLTNSDSDTPSINVNSLPGGSSSGGSSSPIIINIGGSGGPGSNSGSGFGSGSGNRIFTIALGHDFGAHGYLDEKGYIQGFIKDLLLAVCEAGGMDCRLVWDEYTNCWDSEAGQHSVGGKGLFNGWYDACAMWLSTVSRVQVFDFSLPIVKASKYYIWVLKSTDNFDTSDVTGKKFGFMDGYAGDEKCLARQTSIKGSTLAVNQVKHYDYLQQAVDALKSDEVDVLFGDDGDFGDFDELKPATPAEMSCALQGQSLMTTKDNDFLSFWDRAFQKFKDSGKFKKLCEQAKTDHGAKGKLIPCVDAS